jgi:6,7-dimethyl-8-ribityllumazine synthase
LHDLPTIEGDLSPPAGRFAILAARFNEFIVGPLISGAAEALRLHGVGRERVDLVRVPGSFEIPLAAKKLAETGGYAAVICLGCIIRGDTDHYDHVAGAATSGIANAAMATGVPVVFGVLTCDTLEQAIHRAGAKAGNKGAEAALVAVEMVNLLGKLASGR